MVEEIAGADRVAMGEVGWKHGGASPAMVTFRRRVESFPPPLKLEVEEMNPNSNMWQVYALGGFMILKWVWARWRGIKDQGASEDSSA